MIKFQWVMILDIDPILIGLVRRFIEKPNSLNIWSINHEFPIAKSRNRNPSLISISICNP